MRNLLSRKGGRGFTLGELLMILCLFVIVGLLVLAGLLFWGWQQYQQQRSAVDVPSATERFAAATDHVVVGSDYELVASDGDVDPLGLQRPV